jgi:hypothetical protein
MMQAEHALGLCNLFFGARSPNNRLHEYFYSCTEYHSIAPGTSANLEHGREPQPGTASEAEAEIEIEAGAEAGTTRSLPRSSAVCLTVFRVVQRPADIESIAPPTEPEELQSHAVT